MFAAGIDDNTTITKCINNDNNKKVIKRTNNNNKTNKRRIENFDNVSSILQTIHNLPPSEDDGMGDFKPLPPPQSAGVEQTKYRENMANDNETDIPGMGPDYSVLVDNAHNNSMTAVNKDGYERFNPPYKQMYKNSPHNIPYHAPADQGLMNTNFYGSGNDELLEKLNYVINLLEEQQDEKTGNVMEEVILYSFLGIFIIFLVDSFVRVGKYVR